MSPKTKKKCDYDKQPECIECPCGSTYELKGRGEFNHFNTKKHLAYEAQYGKVEPKMKKNENNKRKTVKKQNTLFKPIDIHKNTIIQDEVNKLLEMPKETIEKKQGILSNVVKKQKVHIEPSNTNTCPLTNSNKIFINHNGFYQKSGVKFSLSTPSKERGVKVDAEHLYKYDDHYFIKAFWILQKENEYNNDFFTKGTVDKFHKFQKEEHPAIEFLKDRLSRVKNKKYITEDGKKQDITDTFIGKLNFTNKDWEPLLTECRHRSVQENNTKNKRVENLHDTDTDTDTDNEDINGAHPGKKILMRHVKITKEEQNKNEDTSSSSEDDDELKNNDTPSSADIKDVENFLYPELDDPEFNTKLLEHIEFNTKTTNSDESKKTLDEIQEDMKSSDFILSPHQVFVKNFLSQYTPYNGLFLFHGLGTGKTCSAIGISEEMRNYIKQTGNTKRKKIIIVASPNVQDNFKKQLFDESKLTKSNSGDWNIDGCLGNSMLNEINPTEIKNMKREDVIININTIISSYYAFYGYTKFGNLVKEITEYKRTGTGDKLEALKKKFKIRRLKEEFSDRLIIIDEAHNIRDITDTDDTGDRDIYNQLKDIAKYSENMKLLLLSGTPMYNSNKEIIWIANILNLNDGRGTIKTSDVFDSNGKLKDKEFLIKKLRGYISYVKGENPYTFPLRLKCEENESFIEPSKQMNGMEMPTNSYELVKNMSVCYTKLRDESVQKKAYDKLMEIVRPELSGQTSFGYTALQRPVEALNIVYGKPERIDDMVIGMTNDEQKVIINSMLGERGLSNIMKYEEKTIDGEKTKASYKYLDSSNRIFDAENLKNHSAKISKICETIKKSEGIIMVYSQYIDGGVIPVALALESMGFKRRVGKTVKNLFHEDEIVKDNEQKFTTKEENGESKSYTPHYIMLTGDDRYSPDNVTDLKNLNSVNNKNGEKIKVVIISRAAGEGVDFRNLRQVHILEPWFNLSRTEQIIGRAIRNKSHFDLPFNRRNVEIFLHATVTDNDTESADLYLYRHSSKKAKSIGEITKLIKSEAIDCALEFGNYSDLNARLKIDDNATIQMTRSSDPEGDPFIINTTEIKNNTYFDFTSICDYGNCTELTCSGKKPSDDKIHSVTYNTEHAKGNIQNILRQIRLEFERAPMGLFYFKNDDLYNIINVRGIYTREQFDMAILSLLEDNTEILMDRYKRKGKLISKGDYYYFQPFGITDINASIFERSVKVLDIPSKLSIPIPHSQTETIINNGDTIYNNMKMSYEDVFENDTKHVNRDKRDWFDALKYIKEHLLNDVKIDENVLQKYTVYHLLDTLNSDDIIKLLNSDLYSQIITTTDDNFNKYVKQYFDLRTLYGDNDREYIYILKSVENDGTDTTNKPLFLMKNDGKWSNDEIDIVIAKELNQELALEISLTLKERPIDNIFGLINSKFKRGIEVREFKVREKDVSKNKVGSIVRGTFDKNEQLINEFTKDLKIKYRSIATKNNKEHKILNISKKEEDGNIIITFLGSNDQASITGALPTLIEILVRHRNDTHNDTVSFLNIESFDFFRKYKEKSAIKNW